MFYSDSQTSPPQFAQNRSVADATPRSTERQTAENWSTSIQTVLDQPASALPARLAIGGVVFSACFLAWAWLGQINEVARAQGKLIPEGEVYKVNPVEMGKVARVLVKEGDTVKAGQVLIELDTELANREVERLEKELSAAQMELSQTRSLRVQVELQAQTREMVAQSATQAQAAEVSQAQSSIETTEKILVQLHTDADAQAERVTKIRPLVTEGAISKEQAFQMEQALRDRQRAITEQEGALQVAMEKSQQLEAQLTQKRAEGQELQVTAAQQLQQLNMQIAQLQAKVSQLQTLLATANAKVKQYALYAPVDGMISTLNVRNAGEVVQPAQPSVEIAPSHKSLVMSTILPNQEAGFVKAGMPVQVKLDSYPFQDYGIVPGKVLSVSPDTMPHPQQGEVYRVQVALDRAYVKKDNQTVKFRSGQTGVAEIVTRKRRIMELLVDPFKQLGGNASL